MAKSEDITNDPELQAMIEEEAAEDKPETVDVAVHARLISDLQRRVLELEKCLQRLPIADGLTVKDPNSVKLIPGKSLTLNVGGNRVTVPYYGKPESKKKAK